jgi:hypothetical protein
MRSYFFLATGAAIMLCALPAAALKNVSYPEVKVTVSEAYKPDADFQKMRDAQLVECAGPEPIAFLHR